MTKINLNQSPYFDDYNESKKFYKILFRPGRAVQARELNQIQSTIQKQIERFGAHVFQNGAQVAPGNTEGVKYSSNVGFIKIPRTSFADDEDQIKNYWLGKDIISTSIANNVRATVVGYRVADSIDEVRLYLSYLNASDPTITNETHTEFSPGQNIQTVETTPITAQIVSRDNAVGFISSVKIPQSIYFFNGNFVLVDEQQVFLIPQDTENQDAWNNNPTATVGLSVVETLIAADDDETLLDNALGSPNYSAPGADRLHISATLIQLDIVGVGQKLPENFILLLEIVDGEVRSKVLSTDYSILEDTLARRTYDESGDYTVNPFGIQIKDFLRTDTNDGVHRESEYHFDIKADAEAASVSIFGLETPSAVSHPNFPGKWIPGTSYDIIDDATSFLQLCDNRISIKIDPGKAYVKGYEIQKLSTSIVDIEKSRTLKYRNNRTINTPLGTFFYITRMFGAVDIQNYDTVELHNKTITTDGVSPASKIGTARVLAVEFYSGTVGSQDAIYRLFLFNIQMDPNEDIGQVKSIFSSSPTFTCDVQLQDFRLSGSVTKDSNKLIGQGTSWKNDETQLIKEGDYVRVGLGTSSEIYRVTADPINDNELSVTPNPNTNLTGTVSSSGKIVNGSGTAFTSELVVGDIIRDVASGQERRIISITDNTKLEIESPFEIPIVGKVSSERQPLTGTISSVGTTLTGVGTSFTTELTVGTQITKHTTLAGTVSSSGTTITGVGTVFTTDLSVGSLILAAGQIRKVSNIINNTSLTVDFAFSPDLPALSVLVKLDETRTISQITNNTSAQISVAFTTNLSSSIVSKSTNELTGIGTSFLSLSPNQTIRSNDQTKIISAISDDLTLYTTEAFQPALYSDSLTKDLSNGSQLSKKSTSTFTIDYLYSILQNDSENNGLLFKLPDSFVYTVRGGEQGAVDSSEIDAVYTSRRVLGTNVVPTANQLEFTLSDPNEEFEDFNTFGYALIKVAGTDAGDWFELLPYSSGTPALGKAEIQTLGNQLTIFLNSGDCGIGSEFYVISSILHSGGLASKERSKTLVKGSFVGGVYSGPYVQTDDATNSIINLEKADILRITRVVESPDSGTEPSNLEILPSGHNDVTALYILDNGQTDYFYDLGKVTLRKGFTRPRGRIRVEFDYFEHGTTGNYFSVDSYPIKGAGKQMEYHEIPEFVSSDGTSYQLFSCIDFRPRVNSGGVNSGFSTSLELPKQNFRCDYHFYQGRIDKLFLDKTGAFSVKHGIPDVNPKSPDDPETGMTLYELNFTPYTTNSFSVFPVIKDNRRYTMRDIGKIEKRVKNLEYYTALSLLEKDTSSLEIKDADGNDKFKNGFLVDNFSTFGSCDLSTQDFRASLDRQKQTCRPIVFQDNVTLFEKVKLESNLIARDALRSASNYQKTGDENNGGEVYTLPYTNVVAIEQLKASNVANVNPFSVFTFSGAITLTPWSDEWRDVVKAEPLNVLDQSAYDAARQSFGPDGTTIDYTSTQNNWTGRDVTRETVGQVLEIAGHDVWEKLPLNAQQKIKQDGFMTVPAGYANAGQRVPVGITSMVAPKRAVTTTLTGQQITTQFISTFQDLGFSAPVSIGSRIIDTSLAEFIRSREVKFSARGFMPSARLYAFFDEVDVNQDCKPDGGSYGTPLICDTTGKLSGTFKIPNKDGKKFRTGDREFRLTTSPQNAKSPAPASAGDTRYTARGWIDTTQETFLSTRLFNIAKSQHTSEKDISLTVGTIFKTGQAVPRDPIAQSFFVYDDGGCFITAVDIFFRRKPKGVFQPPIRMEIRPLSSGGNPSNIILPFGEVMLDANEIITNNIDLVTGQISIQGPTIDKLEDLGSDPASQMEPTRFTFNCPIYLSQNEAYCIVLISDSNEYEIWIAQSGPASATKLADTTYVPVTDDNPTPVNTEIGTSKPILSDPYIQGVFFKSQNGISWTADQTVDMKFRIWKAEFNTAVNGEIEFINQELPLKELTLDPFETKSGSSKIRVMHPHHCNNSKAPKSRVVFSPSYDTVLTGTLSNIGPAVTGVGTSFTTQLVVGSFIQNPLTREQKKVVSIVSDTSLTVESSFVSTPLSATNGVLATSYSVVDGAVLNGLSAEALFDFKGFEIESAEMDFYIVDVGINATASGRVGGVGIYATENKRFEELTLLTTPLTVPGTEISWNIKTTQSAGINDYSSNPFTIMPRVTITPNDKVLFDNPMAVSSYINELNSGDTPAGPSQETSTGLGVKKSLNIRAVLKSSNKNVSPIIDTSRFSVALVSNRIDNPRGSEIDSEYDEQITNNIFDNYQCLPTTDAPAIASTANLIWFSDNADSSTVTSIKTANDNIAKHLSKLDIGKLVSISGATGDRNVTDAIIVDVIYSPENVVNDPDLAAPKKAEIVIKYSTSVVASLESNNFTITQKDRFIDEIAPQGGSCSAKYTCKKLTLPRPSNALRIMFDAYRDESCTLDLYYKLEPVNADKSTNNILWQKATYNLDVNGVLTDITPKANRNIFEMSAYECTLSNLPTFIGVQAKIVMRGGNPARSPLIKNFRLIALDE